MTDTSTNKRDLERQIPFTQYEYVDVVFAAADTDTRIPFSHLRLDDPEQIRWVDITPGTVYTGGVDTRASIYRSSSPTRLPFIQGSIVLRATVAGYRTRLLLFVER